MRLFLIFALLVIGTQARAQQNDPFDGVYIGIEGGYADFTASIPGLSVSDDSGVFGGTLGYRTPVAAMGGSLILGVEGNFDFITNGSALAYGASGIFGYKPSNKWMIYGRAGYVRLNDDGIHLDGFQFGGGIEFMVSDRFSVRGDYRRSEFEKFLGIDLNSNAFTLGINFNF